MTIRYTALVAVGTLGEAIAAANRRAQTSNSRLVTIVPDGGKYVPIVVDDDD